MSLKKAKSPAITHKIDPKSPFFDVIEDAYRVFKYPIPSETGVCELGCCMDSEIAADFFTPYIRNLPLDYVQEWFNAACDPDLPKSIWGYLLPRILEVLAADDDPAPVSLAVTLSRFPTGNKAMWSDAEWEILDRFQRLYLAQEICKPSSDNFLDDVICMFGLAKWEIGALLEQVFAVDTEILVERLWADWRGVNGFSIWITAFWEEYESEALAFYTARPLYDRMVAYGMAKDTPKVMSDKALDVADSIRIYASWRET